MKGNDVMDSASHTDTKAVLAHSGGPDGKGNDAMDSGSHTDAQGRTDLRKSTIEHAATEPLSRRLLRDESRATSVMGKSDKDLATLPPDGDTSTESDKPASGWLSKGPCNDIFL